MLLKAFLRLLIRGKSRKTPDEIVKKDDCSLLELRKLVAQLIGEMTRGIAIDERMVMRKIGRMGSEYPLYNYIFVVEDEKRFIPFGVHFPEIWRKKSGALVVKLMVSHIGYDLCQIYNSPRDETGPIYDRSIFPDKLFHGYHFNSDEEYLEIVQKIKQGMFKMLNMPTSDGQVIGVRKKVRIVTLL